MSTSASTSTSRAKSKARLVAKSQQQNASNPNTNNSSGTKSESWVSSNKVLNSFGTNKKNGSVGRNPNFDTDETKLLIQLWGDPKVQRTLITTHKKHAVICQLASKMQEYGYHRSAEEITTRIKNLKCFYNRLKKDMEMGIETVEPNWKHFAEMDEIMTRPIFSVRPNEVPAPSLKYQIEKEMEEQEERRKCKNSAATDEENSNSNDINPTPADMDIVPDAETDMDLSDIVSKMPAKKKRKLTTESLNKDFDKKSNDSKSEKSKDSDSVSEGRLEIKLEKEEENSLESLANKSNAELLENEKNKTANDRKLEKNVENALIIPKEEPIDVDAEDEKTKEKTINSDVGSQHDVLNTTAMSISSSVATLTSAASAITTQASMTNNTQQQQQAKISLVPTNFLMQPQSSAMAAPNNLSQISPVSSQQIHLLQNSNASRILLSGAAGQVMQPSHATNAGIVTTGPGGMKVLLVNADQANAANQQFTMMGKTLTPILPKATANNLCQQQQQQIHEQQQKKQDQQTKKQAQQNRREEQQRKKDALSIRTLLRQLQNTQAQTLEIEKQRLAMERERLDFEKSAVERFFQTMPMFFAQQMQSNLSAQQTPAQLIPTLFTPVSQQMRINPPKLVFATASGLPNGATTIIGNPNTNMQTVTMPANCAMMSNSLPKVLTNSSQTTTVELGDMQMMPKIEVDD